MMRIALAHRHFDSRHLESVKSEMETLGSPVIRAVYLQAYDMWQALEGCHRVRAAHALGLDPELVEVEYSDALLSDVVSDGQWDDGVTVADLCDCAHKATVLEF